ncbi:DUF1918 domain-containing protein [Georgenia faecalis]|uniref:DUF1918 domain-containing protein n=1 Tax=Georgenia faecalis TaxID=2483799 RepID=A0ABV9D9A0_9MICO|nr:DUF1918 domain-containing protein [Georgenia faecalis]
MKANVGDRVVVASRRVDEPTREGEVVEVRGAAGDPPWVVRWAGRGEESLYFPGSDTVVGSAVD